MFVLMESDQKSRTGWYPVQTGRRDGCVSSAQNVKLPSPSIPIPQAIAAFNSKRLSTIDMVYLLGMWRCILPFLILFETPCDITFPSTLLICLLILLMMYRRWSQCRGSTLWFIPKSSLWFQEHWPPWSNHEYYTTENPTNSLSSKFWQYQLS